ncbi:DUF397 domain-containing protein [Streptomyces specialis]|uniref:DUF397 domain-containing protein n=1 Tax=Streptomyces specialis TaxID=498367 RepID=UPI000ABDCC76|nr:DUF397 domain-containing protein [Streptomyces specialis]
MAVVMASAAGDWVKSSFSGGWGECVEVRFERGLAYVRSTLNRDGAVVEFNRAEWEAFLLGVWNGEFDMPL